MLVFSYFFSLNALVEDPLPPQWSWDYELETTWERIHPFTCNSQLYTQILLRYGAVAGQLIRTEWRQGARLPVWKHPQSEGQFVLSTVYITHWEYVTHHYRQEAQFEMELNPSWALSPRRHYVQRNRYELTRIEDNHRWRSVFRHRSRLVHEIKGMGGLKELRSSFELFYDFNLHRIEQSRLTPIEWVWETACKQRVAFALTWRHFFHAQNERNRLMWTVDWVH